MEVNPLGPDDAMEWQDFIRSTPGSNYCLDLAWKDVVAETYGKEPNYWVCREGGSRRITGVAAAFWMDSMIFGRKVVGMPYLDYGGILAGNPVAEGELLAALRWSASTRGALLELRQSSPLAGLESPPNGKVKMDLDLRGRTVEGYWSSLDAKVRNQIRKAEKSGVTVRCGGEELLDAFYRVFCVNMRDLGSPVHSQGLFRNVLRRLPGAEIVIAEWNNWCIGGLFRIRWGGTMSIPWASTLRDYRNHCPNNAIYWDTVTTAFRLGCASIDFGRSTKGEGTQNFKRQWLAEESPLPWYSFAAPEDAPAAVETGPGGLMEVASALWSHLPARYANWIGPQIRGDMPN